MERVEKKEDSAKAGSTVPVDSVAHQDTGLILFALKDAACAIATLEEDVLGFGQNHEYRWPLRDELLRKLEKAIIEANRTPLTSSGSRDSVESGLKAENNELKNHLEKALVDCARKQHGGSGMCCQMRVTEKGKSESFSARLNKAEEALERISRKGLRGSRECWSPCDSAGIAQDYFATPSPDSVAPTAAEPKIDNYGG